MALVAFICLSALYILSVYGKSLPDTYSIYYGGKIYTVDGDAWDKNPKYVMVVDDNNGIIEYIGNYIPWKFETSTSTLYNLTGRVVFPGFHDVHMHPLEANFEAGETCIVPSNTLPLDMLDILKECNFNNYREGSTWLFGHGHSIESILEHIEYFHDKMTPKRILDIAFPNNPVIIMEETSHSVWVNSKALDEAKIDENTEITAGIIMKDDNGKPNGILFENAGNYIMDIAMKSFTNLNSLNYHALLAGLAELRMNGITSVCDARTYWKRNHQRAWERACDEGELTVRAVLGLWAYPHEDPDAQIDELKRMYIDEYNKFRCSLRVNEIKVYSDGLLDSTTAAMLEPYVKNLSLPGMSNNTGMHYFNQNMLKRYIAELQDFDLTKGFDFHIHAIGDAGVEESLNAIENATDYGKNSRETRHRLTHLEIINPKDIGRFKKLNVIADFQVSGEFVMPDQKYRIAKVVGSDRAKNFIPVRSVEKTGARVTLSSDWDVSTLNPFIGIQNAITRGAQSVSLKSAIEMRTKNAAYAMRQEDKVGTLAVGKEADFVIIDQDLFNIYPEQIKQTRVLATVLQGEIIFQQDDNYPYGVLIY